MTKEDHNWPSGFDTVMWEPNGTVVVVSGLPRSGTSMMMKMLEAAGLPLLMDNLRTPDEDNPKGYYEFERVKKLSEGDVVWLSEARGKAVKIISALLEYLPKGYAYKVLFMNRTMEEVLASQRRMLERRGEDPGKINDEEMSKLLSKHVWKVKGWLAFHASFQVLDVDYNALLAEPGPHVRRITDFLGGWLNEEAMVRVVEPNLYRNRA